MRKTIPFFLFFALLLLTHTKAFNQVKLAFVSDTQEPMWIEDLFLKSNQNVRATDMIFKEIVKHKPSDLYILGDVVSLGYKEKKWKAMDANIQQCREAGIVVSALLGNHDVMGRARKGQQKFQQRFPNHSPTGFITITDSIAVILLNSNFQKLSKQNLSIQQEWLKTSLHVLDQDSAIQVIIVACHHAPFSNSKIVGSSENVQKNFLPYFLQSSKSKLFITGHSHAFEHFEKEGKSFLIIGGGGGIHQPLHESKVMKDLAAHYKPMFHYLTISRSPSHLHVSSHYIKEDFSGFEDGYQFTIPLQLN